MTGLLHCPFCGGEAEIKYSEWTDSNDPPERHHVWSVGCAKQATRDYCCPGRLCMNRGLKNRDEAIEAWNTRAVDDELYTREEAEGAFVSGYSLGTLPVGSDPQWDENVQTVDEHMAELGWVRERTCKLNELDSLTQTLSMANGCAWGQCSACGGLTPDDSQYCVECGAKVIA